MVGTDKFLPWVGQVLMGGDYPWMGSPPHSGQPCCIIYCFINLPLDGKLKRSPLVVKYNNMQAINIGTKIFFFSLKPISEQ